MSIEEQIDYAIRNWAAGPGMCEYPRIRTRLPAAPPIDPAAVAAAAGEIDRLAAEATQLIRDQLAREVARRSGQPAVPDPDAPLTYDLAPDELLLLESIKRDGVWWRRLARWIRRSRS